MEQITIRIESGLHCGHCEQRLQALLLGMPGVRQAQVSHADNRAEIHYDPAATGRGPLVQAMIQGGFEPSACCR
ncbi:MAG TPA: cation transporter [Sedimenticola sp.]|nr:cation transporter [Sedimenticola sp.]